MKSKKTPDTRIITAPGVSLASSRKKEIARFHQAYIKAFDEIPEDYQSLKEEAIYLGKLSGHAFVLMAARLKKIKDLSLYKEDGYGSFREFVDAEIPMDRSTVYKYVDILEAFGHETLLAEPELEYTKLRPAVPLLKAKVTGVPKAKIKKQFIAKAKTSTRKEMIAAANDLKAQYGLGGSNQARPLKTLRRAAEAGQSFSAGQSSDLSSAIQTFLSVIPEGKLSNEQKQQLRVLVKEITRIIVR